MTIFSLARIGLARRASKIRGEVNFIVKYLADVVKGAVELVLGREM